MLDDIQFDFKIGHVLVIFPFVWTVSEKCIVNHVPPLPSTEIDIYLP